MDYLEKSGARRPVSQTTALTADQIDVRSVLIDANDLPAKRDRGTRCRPHSRERVQDGVPIEGEQFGQAVRDFNERFAALSSSLLQILDDIQLGGKVVPDAELAALWTEQLG